MRIDSWKDAVMASPGPRSKWAAMMLTIKGACMGAADTVPGVSGGTIALITGIYEQLLAAIKSADTKMVSRLLALDIKGAVAELHLRFLLFLFLGIGLAVISLAQIMNYMLHQHPVPTWSLFFGLIAASIWAVGRKVEYWKVPTAVLFAAGAVAAYLVVGVMPAQTPETLGFIFLSGMLAVCAMILPGISGAFILLILGKYEYVIETLENPFVIEHMLIIAVFVGGCVVGLVGFARVLKFFLDRFRPQTLAFLTGLLLGSLRKIWPWKTPEVTRMIHGELRVVQESNIVPEPGPALMVPVLLMIIGFGAVIFLEWVSSRKASG
ncbi:MAG: DUF368 domain-containing protein [Thermodesulfobacteriota bacterium]